MADRLASLLSHFELSAQVFHTGKLCQNVRFSANEGVGYIHVLRQGSMQVDTVGAASVHIDKPSMLFYMQPTTHHLLPDTSSGAELVCGAIDFGAGCENPLTQAVPAPLVIPLTEETQLPLTLDLLFAEAFGDVCGRQQAMNRLCELVVIQLMRYLMDNNALDVGPLAGLADTRLAKALNAMHNEPAHNWTLDDLAERAGMSRARFAVNFREKVGKTPGSYLTQWRLGLAQSLLRKGKPVNLVAHAVGYSGPAALSRAFRAEFGLSPNAWAKALKANASE